MTPTTYRANSEFSDSLLGPLLLISLLLLTACGSEPQRRDRFFVLEPPPAASVVNSRPQAATLVVQDFAVRGFLGGRQIVYRTREEPLELRRYDVYLWEQPPARALPRNLVEALRNAGLFSQVATAAERVRPDYRLSGELTRFEHRPTDSPPRVLVGFTLTLVSTQTRTMQLTRTYAGEETVRGERPEDMASAFNRLTRNLITQVIQDLAVRSK